MLRYQFTENKEKTKSFISGLILLTAFILTLLIRFSNIADRPLHNDEAVNSYKLKSLIEQGEYKYDPVEYHGPSLYYFSLAGSWLLGISDFKELEEKHIRGIPVVISLLLFLALYFIRDYLDKVTLVISSAFLIVSPYLNFYSRYYIHEPLLATFSILMIVSLFRFYISKNTLWIILAGVFAGLVFATKETSVIIFFSIFLAIILTKSYSEFSLRSIIIFSCSFIIVSILFYSSFFTNFDGVFDSIITFRNYIVKSSSNIEHTQPWYYYIKIFIYNICNKIVISEFVIVLFAIIGIYFSFNNWEGKTNYLLIKWISIFSISTFIIFSLLSYKTPWTIFTGWVGMILISGFGFSSFYKTIKNKFWKSTLQFFLVLAVAHLGYQSYITSFKMTDEPSNPYTYSQPTNKIYQLTKEVNKLIKYDNDVLINVIAKDNQYWPLPWYFRKANNVAWNNIPKSDLYNFDILIFEPEFLDQVTEILYTSPKPGEINLYIPILEKDIPIRPGKVFSSYIKNDFYQSFLRTTNAND